MSGRGTQRDEEQFKRLMGEYRDARDDEEDAASRASALAQEIEDEFGVDAEAER